jgi:hypothetical protein
LPTLFIFVWQATPHSEAAMFFFMYVSSYHNFTSVCHYSVSFMTYMIIVYCCARVSCNCSNSSFTKCKLHQFTRCSSSSSLIGSI